MSDEETGSCELHGALGCSGHVIAISKVRLSQTKPLSRSFRGSTIQLFMSCLNLVKANFLIFVPAAPVALN